jgi:hypothetical protein
MALNTDADPTRIESALPYTGITIAFVVVYSQSPDASQALYALFGQIMVRLLSALVFSCSRAHRVAHSASAL